MLEHTDSHTTIQHDPLVLLPAVDVQGGQAVQLVQGVAGTEKVFGDPLEAAHRWQREGAQWIHLVDLDAAFGRGSNYDVISQVVSSLDISVELSGGIRNDETLERALGTGCTRVNVGTAALERPEWCASILTRYGSQIAIGLDIKGTQLAARGWTHTGGDAFETIQRMNDAGCTRYVVTDVTSDGMLTGPNFDLLKAVCAQTDAHVVASGGISTVDDIRQLADLVATGVEGAIIGTALYVGNFTLAEALEAAGTVAS